MHLKGDVMNCQFIITASKSFTVGFIEDFGVKL